MHDEEFKGLRALREELVRKKIRTLEENLARLEKELKREFEKIERRRRRGKIMTGLALAGVILLLAVVFGVLLRC